MNEPIDKMLAHHRYKLTPQLGYRIQHLIENSSINKIRYVLIIDIMLYHIHSYT